jgi:hypothetical protein
MEAMTSSARVPALAVDSKLELSFFDMSFIMKPPVITITGRSEDIARASRHDLA